MIYFDNAATTYPKPKEVYNALDFGNKNFAFNAGRGHYSLSQKTFEMIQSTRVKLAKLINANEKDVIFTSSATEALNLIIYGLKISEGDTIYISPFEHNSIIRPLYNIKKFINFNIKILPFNKKTWEPDLDNIENEFAIYPPKVIFLSHISNVTGYILPYEQLFSLGKRFRSTNVLDAAQSLGVVNPQDTNNIDYLVFAGHKSLYASFGVAGFIALNNSRELQIIKAGGTGSDSLNHFMPNDGTFNQFEAGSQNSVAIYGLNISLDWLQANNVALHEKELTLYLISELTKIDKVSVYIPQDFKDKIFGIVSINVEGYDPNDVGVILNDEFNICVRIGFHCSPFVHEFLNTIDKNGTIRISLSYFNTRSEIDTLISALKTL